MIRTAAATTAVVLGLAASSSPASAATCKPPPYPEAAGTGEFSAVRSGGGATCRAARKVAVQFTLCRSANGPTGRCVKRVVGYACAEKRFTTPSSLSGSVSCRKGNKIARHSYTQPL